MRDLEVGEVVEHKGVKKKMKLNEKVLANTLGILGAAYYLVCYFVALITPDLYKSVAQSWFHMIDLSSAWLEEPTSFVLGFVSFTAASWVSGWGFGWLYNRLLK